MAQLPEDNTKEYFIKALEDLSNPTQWLKNYSFDFDHIKKFGDNALFAGVSDIDQRIAKATDCWLALLEKNNIYSSILLNSWSTAYTQFLEKIKTSNEEDKTFSPKSLLEIWSTIANSELLKTHRSDDYLKAQKELIKAGAEYRLQEQKIAEVFCEVLHIPNRKEVDELHKTATELRRELRLLKQKLTLSEEEKIKKPRKEKTNKNKSLKKNSIKKEKIER